MLRTHVSNWMSVLMVYQRLKKSTDAKFHDGAIIRVSRQDYTAFYEYLYRKHLEAKGFSYDKDSLGRTLVTTPNGLQLIIPPVFSLVLDEIYLMRIYGTPDLSGKVVVDVGAAIGDTPIFFSMLNAKHVYAFEMDKERSKMARENIALNNLEDRITLFEDSATAEKINQLRYDFIKIDCEGCEYDLLPKLELAGTSEVIMEYHGETSLLANELEKRGFAVEVEPKNTILKATLHGV